MQEKIFSYIGGLLEDIAALDPQLILFALIVVCAVIVLDRISLSASKKRKDSGLETRSTVTVSMDGSKTLPLRHYVSEMQRLAGRPDALISENGFIIPVERKPLANKIRDRYVAQLLVYMRLVEEFEGKKPPYGYLILGPNCRKFKIENSPERQAWLQRMIDEMQAILAGAPARPTPHPRKCNKCDVRDACSFSAANGDEAVRVHSKSASLSKSANSR
jgi:CRISPR/Cas system-associated exonuclease Cas4 (RecB family)